MGRQFVFLAAVASGQPPESFSPTLAERARQLKSAKWIDTLEREVPPLTQPRGDRLPMIMWHGVGFGKLSRHDIEVLAQRGLCQHLQLAESMIPAAIALQEAGLV